MSGATRTKSWDAGGEIADSYHSDSTQPEAARDGANSDKTFDESKCATLDRQIDNLVYELYELTPEEIAIVEGIGAVARPSGRAYFYPTYRYTTPLLMRGLLHGQFAIISCSFPPVVISIRRPVISDVGH